MPEHVSETVSMSRKTAMRIMILTAAVVFVGAGWFWWRGFYTSSTQVFWGMIDNNLSTTGVTRHVIQKSQSQSLDQYIGLQFGHNTLSHSFVVLSQGQGGRLSTVKSESIGTSTNDFNRYVSIDTSQKTASGKTLDTSNITGVWAKSADNQAGQLSNAQQLHQAILTIVPFANLDFQTRHDLVKLIHDKNVYDISTGNIKSSKVDGQAVYVYDVKVNPKAYIEVMMQYAKDIGLGNIGLDASQYEGNPSFSATMTIDKFSRQLVSISFSSGAQEETYSAQGLEPNVTVPGDVIPLTDLQNRVQKSLQ